MSSNKTVFFLIGVLLTILGSSMLIPYALQIFLHEESHSFISSSFITIFVGVLFILANLEKQFRLNLQNEHCCHLSGVLVIWCCFLRQQSKP